MAISDMTDLHNWKTKEILCMNSGLSINHRKRKSIIGFILALRYPHQEENSSVLTTVQQISYQQKISLVYLRCTFQRLGSIHTEKLSDDVLVSFLTWREMRMVGSIRTYSTHVVGSGSALELWKTVQASFQSPMKLNVISQLQQDLGSLFLWGQLLISYCH